MTDQTETIDAEKILAARSAGRCIRAALELIRDAEDHLSGHRLDLSEQEILRGIRNGRQSLILSSEATDRLSGRIA